MYSVSEEVSSLFEELKSLYRTIHQHPELLYDLPKTSKLVSTYLRDLGLEVHENIGKSGVVAFIRNPGPCIVLRADMDALPIQEETNLDFSSQTPGMMHACGHDAHTAMLLVAAKILSRKTNLKGSVKFLFQPAEEGGHGALAMIKDGALEGVDEVYGLHVASGVSLGDWIYHDRLASVNSDRFNVKVVGLGGHGSIPHLTIDPIPVAAQLILAFNRLAGNRKNGMRIQTNMVRSNDTFNAIPAEVSLCGSSRYLTREEREEVKEKMRKICQGLEIMHRVKIEFDFNVVYDSVINSPVCGKWVAKAFEGLVHGNRIEEVLFIGEDFSYYANEKPGGFCLIGANDLDSPSNHSSKMRINEEILMIGTQFWVNLVKERLGSN